MVLSAVAENGRALEYATDELRADHDVVSTAVAQNWRALHFTHRESDIRANRAVIPSPATHAIFRLLKARESVFQTLLLTKTVVHAYRVAQPLFHALFLRQNTV